MSNLVIQDHKNLTPIQAGFVSLRQGFNAVKDLDKGILKAECAKILVKASFEMGSPMSNDAQMLEFQTQALFNELKNPFDSLTVPELYEAFRRGIRGEAGQFFGMCPKTYHQFIKWFFEFPERQKSWVAFLDSQDQIKIAEKPVGDYVKFTKESSIKAFEHYKLTKEMPLACFAYYDCINELIGVEFEEKKTLVTDPAIRKKIVKETSVLFNSLVNQERKKFSKEENLMDIIIDTKGMKGFERMLKREFLKHYFNQLIEEGKQLEL